MKNIFILLIAAVLMNVGNVFGQADTTINGVPYTLFSPGLWVEVEGAGSSWPVGYVHCGDETEVVDVLNPVTTKTWMDRNLGASQVATSSTDAASYGDLYQWGRGADGHQCRSSGNHGGDSFGLATTAEPNAGNDWDGKFITINSSPWDWLSTQDDNLWQGVNGVNNPCPEGYRVPTETELNEERLSWSPNNNPAGAFASPLKLPMAGGRYSSDGSLLSVGTFGLYWSSAVSGAGSRYLNFSSGSAFIVTDLRASGFSVRCIKD